MQKRTWMTNFLWFWPKSDKFYHCELEKYVLIRVFWICFDVSISSKTWVGRQDRGSGPTSQLGLLVKTHAHSYSPHRLNDQRIRERIWKEQGNAALLCTPSILSGRLGAYRRWPGCISLPHQTFGCASNLFAICRRVGFALCFSNGVLWFHCGSKFSPKDCRLMWPIFYVLESR